MITPSPPADFLPRSYQEEIFTQAQQGNVIAALDTGSGKTYISTLLLKWISANQDTSQEKSIFFFVPKVPLVEQQGDFIARHTSLRVVKLHGSIEIDLSDRAGWKFKFKQHDVFVMTAQIFLNFLTHSLIKISDVSLMVFDECHHTRKQHPYAVIMSEYLQCAVQNRPKIFGMTASPIWNTKDPAASLRLLETNLDAKVIGVRQHTEELSEHSPKPTEVMVLYPPPLEDYNYPSPTLWTALSTVFTFFRSVKLDTISWSEIERRYYVTLNNLGPYCASLYFFVEMSYLITRLLSIYRGIEKLDDADLVVPRTSEPQEVPSELFDIAEVLIDFQSYFTNVDNPTALPVEVPLDWCTPKVRTLVKVLCEHHSPTFQGIVFVEQRQTAACLSKVLPHIPELAGLLRCGALVGNVANSSERVSRDIGFGSQEEVVRAFREKSINLIIATSVAEEGLDFPACDLVIRFDSLDHLVGYVQSRGRARNKFSNFVVMIQEDDITYQSKYQELIKAEPELRKFYQTQVSQPQSSHNDHDDEDEDEDLSAADLATRERYVVPSTSAFVTYDNAISLLSQLCSLIPHDLYTALPAPIYEGDFQSTLHLPASLPLSSHDLVYTGPLKSTKKEAKRAVSFLAVKRLHQLNVFDDYLLPAASRRSKDLQDVDGKPIPDVSWVPPMMNVKVRDPWVITPKLWIHPVIVDGQVLAGLVTSTKLVPAQFHRRGSLIETRPGFLLELQPSEEMEHLRMMETYTRLGIELRISASPYSGHLSLFLVPVTPSADVDFGAIDELVSHPRGYSDWEAVGEDCFDRMLVRNVNQPGRTLMLRGIRNDLTPMSLMSDTEDGEPQTYYDYYYNRWTGTRRKWEARVPKEGPMIEVSILARSPVPKYSLGKEDLSQEPPLSDKVVIPQGCCSPLPMSMDMIRAFGVLAPLARRVTDIYRVRVARIELGLPPIQDDLMVQALTIPSADAGYSNQRLETLGDAVLEICTTVHLLNKFPYRHEGQLTILRTRIVSNRFLLSRALDVRLDQFIISEHQRSKTWRHIVAGNSDEMAPDRHALRQFPRRSLQDCMEATLGAAFLTGGIPMALHAGTALGLTFGGPLHWPLRYSPVAPNDVSSMFDTIQERLGYTFKSGRLLREALTHPSFSSTVETSPSYQRLEFLGDAILNLVVVHNLYLRYPDAGSDQLAFPRTKAVCSQALASVAVKKLEVHKVVLANSVDLSKAIDSYVPHLLKASAETIINTGWKFDPPKVLSDVFESLIGGLLIDSGYDYEKTAAVVELAMEDILSILSPAVRLDPISTLIRWLDASVCRQKVEFSEALKGDRSGMQVVLHDTVISGPIVSTSLTVAKNLAAERALANLQDANHPQFLQHICNCGDACAAVTHVLECESEEAVQTTACADP